MTHFNFRIRLVHKIAAIGAIGVVGLCVVGTIYWIGNATQEKQRLIAAEAQSIATLAAKLGTYFLESRRSEKDFLLRNDENYVTRHGELTKKIENDLNSIQGLAQAAEQADLTQKIGAVRAGYLSYGKHFAAVVDAKRKLGLVPDAGLEGTLRKSVHDAETKLKEFGEPGLMVSMLMMRRHEKDYMLRRDPKYGEELKKTAAGLLADLAAVDVASANKEEIKTKLETYQHNFLAWMEVAQILTRESKLASEAYEVIEPIIESMKQIAEKIRLEAEAADAASRVSTTLEMQIAILVAMLVVMLLVFLIGRSISQPLSAMAKAVGLLADGSLKEPC